MYVADKLDVFFHVLEYLCSYHAVKCSIRKLRACHIIENHSLYVASSLICLLDDAVVQAKMQRLLDIGLPRKIAHRDLCSNVDGLMAFAPSNIKYLDWMVKRFHNIDQTPPNGFGQRGQKWLDADIGKLKRLHFS